MDSYNKTVCEEDIEKVCCVHQIDWQTLQDITSSTTILTPCNQSKVMGVDFTGALYIKDNRGERKVYLCLFTCTTTPAVYLEVVLDFILESFMLAFRKFTSRKSTSATVISDNASTYLAAAEELTRLFLSPSLKAALEHH